MECLKFSKKEEDGMPKGYQKVTCIDIKRIYYLPVKKKNTVSVPKYKTFLQFKLNNKNTLCFGTERVLIVVAVLSSTISEKS